MCLFQNIQIFSVCYLGRSQPVFFFSPPSSEEAEAVLIFRFLKHHLPETVCMSYLFFASLYTQLFLAAKII
jgi:hypothetical protein